MSYESSGKCLVAGDAKIGGGCVFGNNAVVYAGAVLGDRVVLGNNVVVHAGAVLGDNVRIDDNSVIGKRPKSSPISTRQAKDDLAGVVLGEGTRVGANAVLYAGSTFGKNCLVADLASVREQCKIGDYSIIGRGSIVEYETVIGNYVKIQSMCNITGNVIIEDHVFFGACVAMANDKYMDRVHMDYFPGPRVRKAARIGANATLLPGVEIGRDSVVGAGAVVVKDVEPFAIVVGVPARKIGEVPLEQRFKEPE